MPTDALCPVVQLGRVALITPQLDRFQRFYEDVLGLRAVVVDRPLERVYRRVALFVDAAAAGPALLVLEVPGFDLGLDDDVVARRGRVDHLAFECARDEGFDRIRRRLVDAGASDGTVTVRAAWRCVLFVDPDGAHHQLQVRLGTWPVTPRTDVLDTELLARVGVAIGTGPR